jgi:hypothetical protein
LAKHVGVQTELARLPLADLRRVDRDLGVLDKPIRLLLPTPAGR